MSEKKQKNSIIIIIALATVFGLFSGVVGELLIRSYLLNHDIPFFGEIDFSNHNYHNTNLIINDAKKVVVEQDNKIVETINSAKNSLVGIFPKNLSADKPELNTTSFNLSNYYQADQEFGQGLIITSDGWIVTNSQFTSLEAVKNYVVITED